MVTLTADVTQGIKDLTQTLIKNGLYKSQSEVVRDAIRQLALKYKTQEVSRKEVLKIITKASKKSGKTLSQTVREMRDEVTK